jgi:hypothetical protein
MSSRDDSKLTRIVRVLESVFSVYGRERSDVSMALWVKLLEPFTAEQIDAAVTEHISTSRFAPTPADIIAAIQSRDGRPTSEEAWAQCPRNEACTVVWTAEMAMACAVASSLIALGDHVAARMAFKDAYERAVREARRQGIPVKWSVSLGLDPLAREGALSVAVQAGRITAEHANLFLPITRDAGGQIATMIHGIADAKRIEHVAA